MTMKEDMNSSRAGKRSGNKTSIIYDQLRASILSGELASGTALSQQSIAKASGASRGPVREAMRRLQQDQLVIARANQGFNVAPINVSDLETVLSLHLSIIAMAIRVGVAFLTDQEIESLDQHADAIKQALEHHAIDTWETLYRKFIFTLIGHTGERTVNLVGQLIDDVGRYRANLNEEMPPVWRSGGKEFKQIAQAAAARDGERASACYVDYMGRIALLVLAGASPLYDAVKLRAYVSQLTGNPVAPVKISRGTLSRQLAHDPR